MKDFSTNVLAYKEFILFIILLVILFICITILIIIVNRLRSTKGIVDKFLFYQSSNILLTKDYKDSILALEYLDKMIEEVFIDYCILNVEHHENVTLNGTFQDKIIKDVTKEIINSISPTMLAIIGMTLDPDKLTEYISKKVLIRVSNYAISKNTTDR